MGGQGRLCLVKLCLVKGGYVRLGPWFQPNITPLNQKPSNKRDNNVRYGSNVLQHTLDLMKHRSIGPCSTRRLLLSHETHFRNQVPLVVNLHPSPDS